MPDQNNSGPLRDPGNALIIAANEGLEDEDFRTSVREMHAQGYPLTKMVEALGLDHAMSPPVLKILESLSPEVVDGIRKATLDMLDRTDPNYHMPVDCNVTDAELDAGVPVEVEVLDESGTPTIHVRPAPA